MDGTVSMEANDFEVGSQKLVEPFKRLPEESILEILGKLPLGDLMVFRCVSKFWCFQLDNNPEFVRMTKNSYSVMLIDHKKRDVLSLDNNTLSSSLFNGIEGCFKKIRCPLVHMGWCLEHTVFVGSCNGLFCMYNENKERCCLWNPYTTEVRFLPRSGFQRIKCSVGKGHGFGYDSNSDDYKYVHIYRHVLNSPGTLSEVHIYVLKRNTWKQMYVPYVLTHEDRNGEAPNGVFCNGALHWFARKNISYYPKVLLALDMTEEVVREIPQPENLDVKKFGTIKYVDVLGGCLCILYSCSAGFQVWVMKEYGMRDSWTIVYNISELVLLKTESFVHLRKIECLKTGEILLEVHYNDFNTAALVLYDPKNEKATVLKLHSPFGIFLMLSLSHVTLSFRYVKSLVKLNWDSHVGEDSETDKDDAHVNVVHTTDDDGDNNDGISSGSSGDEEDFLASEIEDVKL